MQIGNFVELKNTRMAAGVKASHLSYLGDATIGENANIGAGTITCNYDGVNKNATTIGADAFIGSNNSLVAPVTIGDGALTGAGTVVIRDVAPGDRVVGNPARSIGRRRPHRPDRIRRTAPLPVVLLLFLHARGHVAGVADGRRRRRLADVRSHAQRARARVRRPRAVHAAAAAGVRRRRASSTSTTGGTSRASARVVEAIAVIVLCVATIVAGDTPVLDLRDGRAARHRARVRGAGVVVAVAEPRSAEHHSGGVGARGDRAASLDDLGPRGRRLALRVASGDSVRHRGRDVSRAPPC